MLNILELSTVVGFHDFRISTKTQRSGGHGVSLEKLNCSDFPPKIVFVDDSHKHSSC